MEIKTYNWEIIERSQWWYIITATIIIFLIAFSFIRWGLGAGFSVFFLFAIIIAGFVLVYIISQKKITMVLSDSGISIDDKNYGWGEIEWFNIELKDKKPYNIVFLIKSYPSIYTVIETEKFQEFAKIISENVPLTWEYERNLSFKLIKFFKLW